MNQSLQPRSRADLIAALTTISGTLDRVLKADRDAISWLANSLGKHLDVLPARRSSQDVRHTLRVAAALAIGDTPKLGQAEVRMLLRLTHRENAVATALLDAIFATPLAAWRYVARDRVERAEPIAAPRLPDATWIEGELQSSAVDIEHALHLSPDGPGLLCEHPRSTDGSEAGEVPLIGWVFSLEGERVLLGLSTLAPDGVDTVIEAAYDRVKGPRARRGAPDWNDLIPTLLRAACGTPEPTRGTRGRRAPRRTPSAGSRRRMRARAIRLLERLPLEDTPIAEPLWQLNAQPRRRSLRWLHASATDDAAFEAALGPLFPHVRQRLLPPNVERRVSHPRAGWLDDWLSVADIVDAIEPVAPDATNAESTSAYPTTRELLALPMTRLRLPREHPVYDHVPPAGPVHAALHWAQSRDVGTPTATALPDIASDVEAAFLQLRAECRWLATLRTLIPRSPRRAWHELMFVLRRHLPSEIARRPLAELDLPGRVTRSLRTALAIDAPTLADLPETQSAVLDIRGIGRVAFETLREGVLHALSTWRELDSGLPAGEKTQRSPTGGGRAALDDGLSELADLFD